MATLVFVWLNSELDTLENDGFTALRAHTARPVWAEAMEHFRIGRIDKLAMHVRAAQGFRVRDDTLVLFTHTVPEGPERIQAVARVNRTMLSPVHSSTPPREELDMTEMTNFFLGQGMNVFVMDEQGMVELRPKPRHEDQRDKPMDGETPEQARARRDAYRGYDDDGLPID